MNTTSDIKVDQQSLIITCSDQQTLAGTLFQASESSLKGAVMIAPATGIKQTYYYHFARWLAEHRYCVITYDNRGIGASLVGKVKNSTASLQDWGELDMPAVLDTLIKHAPNVKHHLVGHSAGGQLAGLMHNASGLSSMFNYACSTGNLSQMNFPFKLSAWYFMNIFIPLNNLFFGYTKSQWVGMGESLPKAAAQQWAHWCNGSGYVKTDFGKSITTHNYDNLAAPALWVHATDDDIANHANVLEMKNVYTKSEASIISLNPAEAGINSIGHMGYFRRSCDKLWPMALEWFEKH